ncbi:MAG: hypothetical protein NZM09_12500 [Ignavibacterium sp.]|nr:hypothetical protein [Ignavibacterium sp.]MDW8376496.1 hypothetical protein [Ignavibacteriales bacterium]
MNEIEILKHFLEYPVWTSEPIFEKFKTIENADFREYSKHCKQRFLFIQGSRENKVVLVAHADTYFDQHYRPYKINHTLVEYNGFIYGQDENGFSTAIGADDRAGCAILWLLRESGHSLLITDGEEKGRIGSKWLMKSNPDIADLINNHQFIIQVDRRNANDFKCYNVGTDEFKEFISDQTGYFDAGKSSFTDICTLCRDVCGVNLSIGYYNEHTKEEKVNISEWFNTLNLLRNLLQKDLPKFNR